MKLLIAPDSFKESLSAQAVADSLARGFRDSQLDCQVDCLAIGDGGEGTVDALKASLGMTEHSMMIEGPLGQPISFNYARKDQLALIEMAGIVGLASIPKERRNPLKISTIGLGQAILTLAEQGVQKIFVGVGGSASQDGGIGMAAGLGYRFYDLDGHLLEPIGANLAKVASVSDSQVPDLVRTIELTVITDVTNPLCGPNGATYVFAKQKGLPEEDFAAADTALASFYQLVNPAMLDLAGAGAGGAMAAGLVSFAGGQLVAGIDTILDLVDFDTKVASADLVIVGEGRMDQQSLKGGKAPVGVARRTPDGIPVIAICGTLSEDLPDFPTAGIQAAFSTIPRLASLEETLSQASENLYQTARQIGNVLAISKELL